VVDLYHEYKQYGAGSIPIPKDVDFSLYTQDIKELLDDVNALYGQFSAWKLRNMTHNEPPWIDSKDDAGIIYHESMKEYFSTQIHG
jgi:uncharacterized phage-associated protein